MATGSAEYEEVLRCLSSLITQKVRADTGNRGNQWELMHKYLQILELEEPIARLKVVHVAGTKGKGSTCTFAESILRSCGFRTGLFTSPHLMDVRERFRLDGLDIAEEKFVRYFWWCWNKLKAKTGGDIPMPAYFRFLALLAFKIFSDEQVNTLQIVTVFITFRSCNEIHEQMPQLSLILRISETLPIRRIDTVDIGSSISD